MQTSSSPRDGRQELPGRGQRRGLSGVSRAEDAIESVEKRRSGRDSAYGEEVPKLLVQGVHINRFGHVGVEAGGERALLALLTSISRRGEGHHLGVLRHLTDPS